MLESTKVSCGYYNQRIVKEVSFTLKENEMLCIVGPNGSGKSTLLKALAALLEYEGSIKLKGKELKSYKRGKLAKEIALLSQVSEVYFPYTIYETVALGRYAYGKGAFGILDAEDKRCIEESLKTAGLNEIKETLISELSGGQLQRVFLARTLAQNPSVILLDEPTNHLDLKYQIELLNEIDTWRRQEGKAVIGVLHDLNMVQRYADRVLLMSDGEIVEEGAVDKVLQGEKLSQIYNMDIKKFMLSSLKKWQTF